MISRYMTYHRRSLFTVVMAILIVVALLIGRLSFLMIAKAEYYGDKAQALHERERTIKAQRGKIYDRNGVVLAGNKPVSTISVIYSQVKDREKVIQVLSNELSLDIAVVRKKVTKKTLREKIKSNVDKATSDKIRKYKLAGVMIDEDYQRYYPYDTLASKILGFTGADNQGIIGLEVAYDKYLKGIDGAILTLTTAYGVEIENAAEDRVLPVAGMDLYTSLDYSLQKYAHQCAERVQLEKSAKRVNIVAMNPQNGEIYAMVSTPEFHLNSPYELLNDESSEGLTQKQLMNKLNDMWRNPCVSDTYEPGSTFKVLVAGAALDAGVVKLTDTFNCPGYRVVEDRKIRCHDTAGHGTETFVEGVKNSCNPVFMDIGARLGVDNIFRYFTQFNLFKKTGIDLPGEAGTIFHKKENVKAVELATISFGQSFQVTPIRLMSSIASMINGGTTIVPHLGVYVGTADKEKMKKLSYEQGSRVITKETSTTLCDILEQVVSDGTGKNAAVEGYKVGAKTGTSEKLPRGNGKYIASTIGFAQTDNPKILVMVIVDEPTGVHFGGTIAAPVVGDILAKSIPYLGS